MYFNDQNTFIIRKYLISVCTFKSFFSFYSSLMAHISNYIFISILLCLFILYCCLLPPYSSLCPCWLTPCYRCWEGKMVFPILSSRPCWSSLSWSSVHFCWSLLGFRSFSPSCQCSPGESILVLAVHFCPHVHLNANHTQHMEQHWLQTKVCMCVEETVVCVVRRLIWGKKVSWTFCVFTVALLAHSDDFNPCCI